MLLTYPFILLLVIPLTCAIVVSFFVVMVFRTPLSAIFKRIFRNEISAWLIKYVKCATYLFGISGGLIGHLSEEYMPAKYLSEVALDSESSDFDDEFMSEFGHNLWISMIIGLIMSRLAGTLHAIAQMYLVLFVVSIIAYIAVKVSELRETQLR